MTSSGLYCLFRGQELALNSANTFTLSFGPDDRISSTKNTSFRGLDYAFFVFLWLKVHTKTFSLDSISPQFLRFRKLSNMSWEKARGDSRILLMWARQLSPLFSPLSRNILREVGLYMEQRCLVWVKADELLRYDLSSSSLLASVRLGKCIKVSEGSRWAIVNASEVVVCGGGSRR